ncbi:MAG: mechanosensitive ion channel family protein [Candidatus Sericytochromatia bacterium]|nr:mechanosensitive ion channel family protein [Candidatus Tanganyikabacteria bacterium]
MRVTIPRRLALFALLIGLFGGPGSCLLAGPAGAQVALPGLKPATAASAAGSASAAPGSAAEPEDTVDPDSPRAAMTRFQDHTRAGEFDKAANYLLVPWSQRKRGPELARRLKAVLDRHDWLDPEALSGAAGGDRTDGLDAGLERVGRVPGRRGREDSVFLVRRYGSEAGWAFSSGTVRRIDGWYQGLENLWALEHLPEPLLRPGPRELLWWQWIALPVMALLAWVIGWVIGLVSRSVLKRVAARTETPWDDQALERLAGPINAAWALGAAYMLVPVLALYEPAEAFVYRLLSTGFFLAFFWALLVAADTAGKVVETWPWAKQNPSSRSLILLGVRVTKVGVLAMGVIAILSFLGYPVTSLVAGLGIGGLALALASQKTVEHMFGAISLGIDQPFRVGDFVKVDGIEGTVEVVGLRSTRIRTPDRTVISLPNGKLAEMRIESVAARDRAHLQCQLGLAYGTSAEQVRAVLDGLEAAVRAHPRTWQDDVQVRLKTLGESALIVEIQAWFEVEWPEFTVIRQEVLLAFLDVVESAGASLAFPTRTVHLVAEPSHV